MFEKLIKIFVNMRDRQEYRREELDENSGDSKEKIPKSINDIKKRLKEDFIRCDDFFIREISFGKQKTKVAIVFLEGFTDKEILSENVINPIINYTGENSNLAVMELLREKIISASDVSEIHTLEDTISAILTGDAVVYVDGEEKAFKIGVRSPEKRSIDEPDTEVSIKGPREGFTENLKTNTILLRRKIKNTKFKMEKIQLGEQTRTDILICYIEGIAKDEIVEEAKQRISKIKLDGILATGYIEQCIQDDRYSLFPSIGNSEKPDKVAAKLLEGRVAIMADGTPTVLTVPFIFIESIQATEDYYGDFYFASFARILRVVTFFLSMYLPAIYVALTIFHQRVLPFKLMMTMAATREGIPFSSFMEALLMVIIFEVLREAGIRMPRAIGQAVSIVGAIVLGDAAVNAGIASAPLVIVAAFAGICSFINPPMMKVGSLIRIALLIVANMLGFLGIAVLTIIMGIKLCNKRSFGIPYLTPFSPLSVDDLKDSLIVVPMWAMFSRPKAIANPKNTIRTTGKPSIQEEKNS